jgi:hypothetical protein
MLHTMQRERKDFLLVLGLESHPRHLSANVADLRLEHSVEGVDSENGI